MTAPDPSVPGAESPAAYRVVARRYRPQRFDELVGQEHVARGLSGAIESGRVGHAYLFTGARGVGKTSAARIFAKALECAAGPAAEPCNVCDACGAIAAGQDVDVVEIDAASNRGIDEIRSLRQNVAVRPARGRFKVYIIDEVHMLTREAFNALLKTLEEPPGHVKFVLCTTEPEKLPITILSRCQRFDFVTVDAPAIARRLAQIVAAEGAEVSADALALIARRAAGSMRDSQSLLEQLLGCRQGEIGVDDVHAVIGTGREERIGALVAAIAGRDAAAALAALDDSLAGGADAGGVLEQVLAALRDCLVASVGCESTALLEGDGLGIDLGAIGKELGTETVLAMLQIVDHALSRMRTSGHARVLAEMAVVRLASLENLDDLAEVVARVAETAPAAPVRAAPVARIVAAPAPREKKTTDLTGVPEPPLPEPPPPAVRAMPPQEDALSLWKACGETVGGLVAEFAALAVAARFEADDLHVVFPPDSAQATRIITAPQTAAKLAAALAAAVGRPVRQRIAAEPKPAVAEGAVGAARGAAGTPATAARPPAARGPDGTATRTADDPLPASPRSQAALLRATMEHPLVAHARERFDAAIRKVEAGRARPAAATAEPAATDADDGGDGDAPARPAASDAEVRA